MPCHHDFLEMSHHRANTKYGKNTSFIDKEFISGPKTALMLLYLDTFTMLTLNNIKKKMISFLFLALLCVKIVLLVLLAQWWDILKYKNAN